MLQSKITQLQSLFATCVNAALTVCLISTNATAPALASEVLSGSISTVTVSHKQAPAKDKGVESKTVDEEKMTSSEAKLTLAKDFVSLRDKDSEEIIDFANKRILSVNFDTKEYSDVDLHGKVYFKVAELQNRYALGEILQKSGAQVEAFNAFDDQSIFAVVMPNDKHKAELSRTTENGTVSYKNAGRLIVSYTLSSNAIADSDRVTYEKALAGLLPIHPDIRKALSAEKYYPKTLLVNSRNGVFSDTKYEVALSKVGGGPSNTFSSLGDYKLKRDEELKSIYEALDKLGANSKLPEKDETFASARKALKEDNALDAALIVLEYCLITGQQKLPEYGEILRAASKDADANTFFAYISPKSEAEAKTAVAALALIDRRKLSKGYLIDIMRANIYSDMQQGDKAVGLMKEVLSAHPLIVGAYHDLGKMYMGRWDMATAWSCFRIADKLVPNHPQMGDIRELEKSLETEFPEFF